MATSGTIARTNARLVRTTTSRALNRRAELVGRKRSCGSASTAGPLFEAPPDEQAETVDEDGNGKEDHTEGDERFRMQGLRGLVELVGDDAREGEAGREDRA